jgi:hypothetical protein
MAAASAQPRQVCLLQRTKGMTTLHNGPPAFSLLLLLCRRRQQQHKHNPMQQPTAGAIRAVVQVSVVLWEAS